MGVANVATPGQIVDHNGLSTEQFDLLQRFEADFNAIQHFLQVAAGIEEHETFTQLVLNYAKNHAGWAMPNSSEELPKFEM